jgi:mRNA interferase MazF
LRIVTPITTWREDFDKIWWLVKLIPNEVNGLDSISAVNCFQLRCVSLQRMIKKIGNETTELENIAATSQNCIEVM